VDRRTFVYGLGAAILTAPLASEAQSAEKVYRLGLLSGASSTQQETQLEALRAGLRELGYLEGKNIVIEYRWAEEKYDRLPDLAAELVRLKVDLIMTGGTPATQAAMQATTTIPIVMMATGDPLRTGLVASLARPGGNVTGVTQLGAEVAGKRLQILKDTVPRLSRVAFLRNPTSAAHTPYLNDLQAAARALRLTLQSVEVQAPGEFEMAFAGMMQQRPDALIVSADPVHRLRQAWIVDFAGKRRLPVLYQLKEYVEAGGLMSYGTSVTDNYRRGATYVDKILKGAKPGDLPVEQPTKFELVINLKTAKALGLTIPPSVLLTADQVIQ
jgi:putative tryptophan/tyrosine transport system substrate-binding protein